jgi:hypothetical protein
LLHRQAEKVVPQAMVAPDVFDILRPKRRSAASVLDGVIESLFTNASSIARGLSNCLSNSLGSPRQFGMVEIGRNAGVFDWLGSRQSIAVPFIDDDREAEVGEPATPYRDLQWLTRPCRRI